MCDVSSDFTACSQSLSTLTMIEEFLAKRTVPPSPKATDRERTTQNWVRNLNYYSKWLFIMIKTGLSLLSM